MSGSTAPIKVEDESLMVTKDKEEKAVTPEDNDPEAEDNDQESEDDSDEEMKPALENSLSKKWDTVMHQFEKDIPDGYMICTLGKPFTKHNKVEEITKITRICFKS